MGSPDLLVTQDDWSDLSRFKPLPEIDMQRLYSYRLDRIRGALKEKEAALALFVSPMSLRYAVDYRSYALYQSHAPTTYLIVPVEGPVVAYECYGVPPGADESRKGWANSFFDGGTELTEHQRRLALDVRDFLREIGTDNRRVAVEYVNPSLTQALLQQGLEVIDGVAISEEARRIKSTDEIECMKWAIEVAQFGIDKMKAAMKPGVSEVQLWGLLNYTNLANQGDWHNGRMLASGPRTNPWLQEATGRKIESGDLVGFDTDMVGPFGYFADISRTFHCGPAKPTARQKEIYQWAVREVEYNMALVKPGMNYSEYQAATLEMPEEFHEQAYVGCAHGAGMTDEAPLIKQKHRQKVAYDGVFEPGMVLCIETYCGAVGEPDGVKIEQQVLVTDDGIELLSTYPYEEELMS
jgi:Xaa-Pro aminopeptidase